MTASTRSGAAALALLAAACAGPGDGGESARLEAGRRVFTELSAPACSTCHTLADAGAAGVVGPSLDELRPDSQRVAAAVTHGIGVMPAQGGRLTDAQIGAVAGYVARVAGRAAR